MTSARGRPSSFVPTVQSQRDAVTDQPDSGQLEKSAGLEARSGSEEENQIQCGHAKHEPQS
jgi:hypothetical protein